MINFNTVNKANTAQSLLPSFNETTDTFGESFQSIFDSVKDKSYDNSINPYSKKESSYSSYQENNSYSSYSDNKKYSERETENKYSKDDVDYNKDDERFSKDKENYEAVERKVYREETPAEKYITNPNTAKEGTVFEKKDIKGMQNKQAETSNKDDILNQEIQLGQNLQLEDNQIDTISFKDMLALLQTAVKNNTSIEAANDEEAALENINIDADVLLQNIDVSISELNISDDLKMQLQNIISSFENIDKADLQKLVEYINVFSEDINITDINAENISLEEISEKILGTEIDSSSLEKAYTVLQEKISENTNQQIENIDVNIENTDDLALLTADKSNNTEIIDNLSALIDEAVKEAGLETGVDKLGLAKNIILTVKTAAEKILSQSNVSNSQVSIENTSVSNQTLPIDNIEGTVEESNIQKLADGKLLQEQVKDRVKQIDTVSVKDIQKEFKTANVEVTESLRGESNAKAEIKANTVNLTETGKNLQNNLNQKEMMMAQSNTEENFSTYQNDKGNNFNYFLKSSAEAQVKYDTAQSKETQAPYNMKEPRDIERLVRTMQSSVSKGESKLTVVLTPENLGKMQIQLSENGGKITAKFLSDNENSHKLIMAQSDLLKNQLSEKGIVVDNMEFAYNDTMSKQQNNDEQGRRTSKQAQKGKNNRYQEDDLEVGTEVANKKATGVYA